MNYQLHGSDFSRTYSRMREKPVKRKFRLYRSYGKRKLAHHLTEK